MGSVSRVTHGSDPLARGSGPLAVRKPTATADLMLRWRGATIVATWLGVVAYVTTRVAVAAPRIAELVQIVVLTAAGVGAICGALSRRGRAATGWTLVAIAWLASAIGVATWFDGGVVGTKWAGVGWVRLAGNVLYNAYYPLMAVGLFLLAHPPATRLRKLRAILEVCLVGGTCQLLLWYFIWRHIAADEIGSHMMTLVSDSIGETVVLLGAAWLLGSDDVPELPARILGVATLATTLADLAAAQFEIATLSVPLGVFADIMIVLSGALVATAGMIRPSDRRRRRRLGIDVAWRALVHLPSLALLVALALLVFEAVAAPAETSAVTGLAIGVPALVVLALAILAVASREHEQEADARSSLAERLQQAQRFSALGQLAGSTAHDFNNVIQVLQLVTDELKKTHPDLPQLVDLEEVNARATQMCRRLLDLGKSRDQAARVDLGEVGHAIEPLARRLLPQTIRFDVDVHGPAFALIDRGQLELAIVNLITNARDAISEVGAIAVNVDEVVVTAGDRAFPGIAAGTYGRVRVTDDGCGMSADTKARALEPFFTTKSRDKGTGLGLASVAELVAANGGFLIVESTLGEGTSIALLLRPDASTASRDAAQPVVISRERTRFVRMQVDFAAMPRRA
jgi:signal transduction histidine kinase